MNNTFLPRPRHFRNLNSMCRERTQTPTLAGKASSHLIRRGLLQLLLCLSLPAAAQKCYPTVILRHFVLGCERARCLCAFRYGVRADMRGRHSAAFIFTVPVCTAAPHCVAAAANVTHTHAQAKTKTKTYFAAFVFSYVWTKHTHTHSPASPAELWDSRTGTPRHQCH